MAGVVLEPIESPEAILRNLQRLNEVVVAMQGGQIAMENIVGYEDLATDAGVDAKVAELTETVDKLKIPVGGRYYSSTDTNPSEFFEYGTWALVGAGRVEIGVGSAMDSRADEREFSAGATGGEFAHQITVGEMPSHSHSFNKTIAESGGKQGGRANWTTGNDYGHLNLNNTGGNQPHNNLQPYEVIYKWERTE